MIRLLTNNNEAYSMNIMPDVIDELRYCVLDYSDQNEVDFFFIPMMFMETFTAASVLLQVGKYQVQMPLDWSLVIADKYVGDLEIIEVKKLNDRPFTTLVYNPISGYSPEFLDITAIDIFPDIKWHVPKLKFGHILATPIGETRQWATQRMEKKAPPCMFIVRDTNKLPETLDIGKIF